MKCTRRTIDWWKFPCDALKNAKLMAAGSKADAYLAVRNEEDLIAAVVDARKTWLVRLDRFRSLVRVPGVRQAPVVAHVLADCPVAIHLRISHELRRWIFASNWFYHSARITQWKGIWIRKIVSWGIQRERETAHWRPDVSLDPDVQDFGHGNALSREMSICTSGSHPPPLLALNLWIITPRTVQCWPGDGCVPSDDEIQPSTPLPSP